MTAYSSDSSIASLGRNTQRLAGSDAVARAATNRRSSSGTKSDVRAPAAVATWRMRRYAARLASKMGAAENPPAGRGRRLGSRERSPLSPRSARHGAVGNDEENLGRREETSLSLKGNRAWLCGGI